MKKMTYDAYDAMCDRIQHNLYQCDGYWPTKKELQEKLNGEINPNIDFLTWLLETNDEPETEEELESRRYINKLLRDNLKLYDPKESNCQDDFVSHKPGLK